MNQISRVLLVVGLCLSTSIQESHSQAIVDSIKQDSWTLFSLHPLSTVYNEMKLDIERKFPNSRLSLFISPELSSGTFIGAKSNVFIDANRDTIDVSGFGTQVGMKYHVLLSNFGSKYSTDIVAIYTISSLRFASYGLDYTARVWEPYTDNGVEYLQLVDKKQTNSISQFEFAVGIGGSAIMGGSFFLDCWLSYSMISSRQKPAFVESTTFSDRHFSAKGVSIALGVKIGVVL